MSIGQAPADNRAISEIYGTVLIISLAFITAIALVGIGFFVLDDTTDDAGDRLAQDSVLELHDRLDVLSGGTGENSVTWVAPQGTAEDFAADSDEGKIQIEVKTNETYWEASSPAGALVEADNQTQEADQINLGAITHEAGNGERTVYQAGGVFRVQGDSTTVLREPNVAVTEDSLDLSFIDVSELEVVSEGQEITFRQEGEGTDASDIDSLIAAAMSDEDGDIVAPASVTMTITGEYVDAWTTFAEESLDHDGVEVWESDDIGELDDNQIRIGFGEFGEGLELPPDLDDPYGDDVIYTGLSEYAHKLHDDEYDLSEAEDGGFAVDEPANAGEYSVGVHVETATTNDEPEWWVWNDSEAHWENIERASEEIPPRESDDGFPEVDGDEFDIGPETVTCVVASGSGVDDFVDEDTEGCLSHAVGANESKLQADFQPYLEVTDVDVDPAPKVLDDEEHLDIEIGVENIGPGDAEDEPVGAFLADQEIGEFVVAGNPVDLDSGETNESAVEADDIDPRFLLTSRDDDAATTSFDVGGATAVDRNITESGWVLTESASVDDVEIDEIALDSDSETITAGESIRGDITFNNTADGEDHVSVSALLAAGPNREAVSVEELDAGETRTVRFTINTDEHTSDFDTVTAEIPGVDDASTGITVNEADTTPEFVVEEIDYNTTDVVAGETVQVDATIANEGGVRDAQPVQLATTDADATAPDRTLALDGAVELGAGEDTEISLIWETSTIDTGEYNTSVFTRQDNGSAEQIEVRPGAQDDAEFEIEIVTAGDVVAPGTLEVTYDIENVGDAAGERVVWLTAEDDDAAFNDTTVSLGTDESTTETLAWETSRDDAGDRTVVVATLDGEDTEDVEIISPDEDADLELIDLAVNEPSDGVLIEGEQAAVTATVENPSSETIGGTGAVVLEDIFGNATDIAETEFLDPGEETTVDLSWQTLPGDAGEGELTAVLEDQSETVEIEVEPQQADREPVDVVFVHDESGSMVIKQNINNDFPESPLAEDVSEIGPADFFVQADSVTVPGGSGADPDGDQVWLAEQAGQEDVYYRSGDTVDDPAQYDSVTIYDVGEFQTTREGPDMFTVDDETIAYLEYSSWASDGEAALPGDEVELEEGGWFSDDEDADIYELDHRETITDPAEIREANPDASFYTAGNSSYRNTGEIEDDFGPIVYLTDDEIEEPVAWVEGSGTDVDDYDTVPDGQAWIPTGGNGIRFDDLRRPGEQPETDSGEINIRRLGEDPFAQRIGATERFLDELDDEEDRVGYVQFDGSARTMESLTEDFDAVRNALAEDRGGATDIAAGIYEGIDQLEDAENERVIVLLGDGLHNQDGPQPEQAAADAADADITIYSIGLGEILDEIDDGKEQLETVAEETGGEFFFAENADELVDEFGDVADEVTDIEGPQFEVEIKDEDLDDKNLGETVTLEVNATNVGDETGEQPIWLVEEFSGTPVDSATPEIENGSSEDVTLSWDVEISSEEFDEDEDPPEAIGGLEVRTAADSDRTDLTVLDEDSEFAVDAELGNPGDQPIAADGTIEIDVAVENTESGLDEQAILLRAPWGAPVDSERIELDGGEETDSIELSWDLSDVGLDRENITLDVTSDDDVDSVEEIELEESLEAVPEYDIVDVRTDATEADGQSIEAGNDLEVTAEIENIGDTEAEQFVELRDLDNNVVDIIAVEIPNDDETHNRTLTWETTLFDDGIGDVTVSAAVGNEASERVNITEFDPDPEFDVEIETANASPPDDSIVAGAGTLEVEIEIENTGDEERAIVTLDDADDPDRIPVIKDFGMIDEGDSESGTLEYRTAADDHVIDEIEVSVDRYDVTETVDVNITRAETTTDVEIASLETNAENRDEAVIAGDPDDKVEVTVNFEDDGEPDEGNVVSLYGGDSAETGDLLSFTTYKATDGASVAIDWRPAPGDGDNFDPQAVTVSVQDKAATTDVYVDEVTEDVIDLPDDTQEPIDIDIDEIKVS